MIVTAQKREQNLQDVPIAVIALVRPAAARCRRHDIKNMQLLTPGLTVTSTTSETSTTARIRGIGTVGDNVGLESSVGVVIDGVYLPRNGVGFGDLGEIDRIEVLEGPQGELFGKNNDAGVINIVTKRPSTTFGGPARSPAAISTTGSLRVDHRPGGRYSPPSAFTPDTRSATASSTSRREPGQHRRPGQQPQLLYGARPVPGYAQQRRQRAVHRRLLAPQRELLSGHAT